MKPNSDTNNKDILALKELMEVRLAAIEKATELASDNLKTRLDSLNEWRLQNKDERAQYVTHSELKAVVAFILALVGIAISVVSLIKW